MTRFSICEDPISYSTSFDSDSVPIGIDTCTSATLSGFKSDFIGKMQPVTSMNLRGVGGTVPIIAKGTLRLTFLDDNEKHQILLVRNAYYAPKLTLRLLSPQQWSKQGPRSSNGTYLRSEQTSANVTILRFPGGTKTILHNSQNNLPILHTISGFSTYSMFQLNTCRKPQNKTISFELDEQIHPQSNSTSSTAEQLLLHWHNRLGHLPFKTIKHMAQSGLLDKRIASIRTTPFCPGCQYGKQSRKAWRKRRTHKHKPRKFQAAQPGDLVCVDTLSSTTIPGLVPQLRGKPTNKRFYFATIFVDVFSRLPLFRFPRGSVLR